MMHKLLHQLSRGCGFFYVIYMLVWLTLLIMSYRKHGGWHDDAVVMLIGFVAAALIAAIAFFSDRSVKVNFFIALGIFLGWLIFGKIKVIGYLLIFPVIISGLLWISSSRKNH